MTWKKVMRYELEWQVLGDGQGKVTLFFEENDSVTIGLPTPNFNATLNVLRHEPVWFEDKPITLVASPTHPADRVPREMNKLPNMSKKVVVVKDQQLDNLHY